MWNIFEGRVLVPLPPLHNYYKLQQLITYSIAVYKQQVGLLGAGKSQGKYPKLTSLVAYFIINLINAHRVANKYDFYRN